MLEPGDQAPPFTLQDPSGKRVSLEDFACAGALVRRLTDSDRSIAVNDAAELARAYDSAHGHAPEAILRQSEHGRYLIEIGFEGDLAVCAAVDGVPVVPFLKDGRITPDLAGDGTAA